MHFMAVKKSRKRSVFVIYSYLKDTTFTTIKRTQSSNLGFGKGVQLYLFSQKWYIKGKGV